MLQPVNILKYFIALYMIHLELNWFPESICIWYDIYFVNCNWVDTRWQ